MTFAAETVAPLRADVQTEIITTTREFYQLASEWRALHALSPQFNPFTSWEWMYSWWLAYGKGKQLYICIWRLLTGEAMAIVPLFLTHERILPGLEVTVARLVGDGSSDSDYLDAILHPDFTKQFQRGSFPAWLQTDKTWDVCELRTLPPGSPIIDSLSKSQTNAKLYHRVEGTSCAWTVLPAEFEDFLARCRPRFRTKIRSLIRRFEADTHLKLITDASDLRRRLHSMYELHERRWLKKGQRGVFVWPQKRRFYAHFVPRFVRRGWLRFFSLYHADNGYVAHQLCFGGRERVFLLQEGFAPEPYDASYGQMLRALVFRYLIREGVAIYDFLGGMSRHKADWQAKPSQMSNLFLAKPHLRSRVYFQKPVWIEAGKAWLSRRLPEPVLGAIRALRRRR